ncbi:MAG: hypothetical protein KVP17_000724 [Porospora cf. gigantea B]|uniref:uncharacterized protein n=2 Tax=Porospora cf. gigantea B TaxID=2853592 RepID=UPI003571BA5C|nr:MAG: hypothetical protein KVP17_000724 [Porospora cf. gigantea B]
MSDTQSTSGYSSQDEEEIIEESIAEHDVATGTENDIEVTGAFSKLRKKVMKAPAVKKDNQKAKKDAEIWSKKRLQHAVTECNEKLKTEGLSKNQKKKLLLRLRRLNMAVQGELQWCGQGAGRIYDAGRMKRPQSHKERRRLRKTTCLRCGSSAHLLSECDLQETTTRQGNICFNCGSTDHILRECLKPVVGDSLPFAKCFLCKGDGHISSQCPKNPQGMYRKGGGCHNCGSVHHLVKFCPEQRTFSHDEKKQRTGANFVVRVCRTCGSADHKSVECPEGPGCLKCGEKGHEARSCRTKVPKLS